MLFRSLGGESGISADNIACGLTFQCERVDPHTEPVLHVMMQMSGVTVGGEDSGFELGEVTVEIAAFVVPPDDEWEFRGVIRGEASFGHTSAGATLGATVSFNTIENEFEVTAFIEIYTPDIRILMEGRVGTCSPEGNYLRGSLQVTTELPFTLPQVTISATHFCKPYQPKVFEITATVEADRLMKMIEGDTSRGLHLRTRKKFAVSVALRDHADDHEALADAVAALNNGLKSHGLDKGAEATARLYRSVEVTIQIDNADYGAWWAIKKEMESAVSEKVGVKLDDVRCDGYPQAEIGRAHV